MSSSFTTTDIRNELGSPSVADLSSALLASIKADEGTLLGSAARAARILYRKFALKADKALGDVKITYQNRAKTWKEIAADFEYEASLNTLPFMGGISVSDKDTREEDTDGVEGFFTRDMFDYLEIESSSL